MAQTGFAGARSTAAPVFTTAKLASAYARGTIVKENASGLLTQAADGDDVFGVLACDGEANGNATVQVGGLIYLTTTGSPGFTRAFQPVVCAGSNTVDGGTAGDPEMGFLVSYSSATSTAVVELHGTALRVPARALFDGQGFVSYPVGALTNDRPIILTGSKVATPARQGVTGSRPGSNFTGQNYFDTTLLEDMTYNGTRWQSATLHDVYFGLRNTVSATSNPLSFIAGVATTDATIPWIVPVACRLVKCRFSLIGGTGAKTWTPRLRLNGSGSDTWAGTARSSTTSWQSFDDTVDQALAQGDRVQVLVDTGSGEAGRWLIWFGYYKT